MTFRRALTIVSASLGVACGGSDPGVLSIQLDSYPRFSKSATVALTGVVTRTPVKDTRIIVSAIGGTTIPNDTADGTGHFSLTLPLTANANNVFTISATDKDGSTGSPVNVTIREDNLSPAVSQATPADASDNVATNTTTIQEKLNEPVIMGLGGGIELSRQGAVVPGGTTSISADSLTLTYTNSTPLSPNAIYRVGFNSVSDVAGNNVTAASCFVTTITGANPTVVVTDSTGDNFSTGGSAGTLQRPDLVGARFAREGSLFSGIFQFIGPRAFSNVASNGAFIFLDLDVDQDSTTGFVTFKDFLFQGSFPQYSSGTKSEYVVGLEPNSDLGDSAYVAQWVPPADSLVFQPLGLFLPGVCGPFMGFVLPFSILGNDDGNMNAVVVALAANGNFLYADPAPTVGHFTLDLAAVGPAPDARAAILPAPGDRKSRVQHRIPRYLSRH